MIKILTTTAPTVTVSPATTAALILLLSSLFLWLISPNISAFNAYVRRHAFIPKS